MKGDLCEGRSFVGAGHARDLSLEKICTTAWKTMKPLLTLCLLATLLSACGSQPTFKPNKMGAQQNCAHDSASLSQYNECSEYVGEFYRDYEQHQAESGNDGG